MPYTRTDTCQQLSHGSGKDHQAGMLCIVCIMYWRRHLSVYDGLAVLEFVKVDSRYDGRASRIGRIWNINVHGHDGAPLKS